MRTHDEIHPGDDPFSYNLIIDSFRVKFYVSGSLFYALVPYFLWKFMSIFAVHVTRSIFDT